AIRVLRVLWDAQTGQPPGRSLRFLCAHLQLHQDELEQVLAALKRLGYVVNTENGDADQWVLSIDQREATLGPLIDDMLLDRQQPSLHEPENHRLLDAVRSSLGQPDVRLADLFEADAALPKSR